MRDYRGHFEVHITVLAATTALLGRFAEWCRIRELKCVRIVLARGEHVEQPMATWRRSNTTLPLIVEEAQRCAAELTGMAIPVVRVKVEASPHNQEVPLHDADATAHGADNYFEHHVKLLRDTTAPCQGLLRACEQYGAHLSRNAFREVAQGQEERFVTLRSYGVGWIASQRQLQLLLAALNELGEQVVEHESEYCVYDSNLALDAGWLPKPSQPTPSTDRA
jgi:hypothetical protein